MPTKREREYYSQGYRDGFRNGMRAPSMQEYGATYETMEGFDPAQRSKPKRKLSAWQRYIKNKRNHITYRDGKLNLKAMGVQYRKKKRR
jgi:hypothetical protein